MPDKGSFTALILGDVVGASGCRALFLLLPGLIKAEGADLVVVNGENAADGFGIDPETLEKFYTAGADVVTSGNHIWQKREIFPLLDSRDTLLRPHNYPPGAPGHGFCVVEKRGRKAAVLNLQGRVAMTNLLCPLRTGAEALRRLRGESRIILVDFHAEDPEEKEALAQYLDGEASVVFGTHTHVQTADERILPGGTAFITDIGMTGPRDSVIGFRWDTAVQRSLTQMPLKMEVSDAPADIQGIRVEIDGETGKARSIRRIKVESRI